MKRFVILIASALVLCSCGVGSYSVSSGKADQSHLSFTTPEKKAFDVVVYVDGESHKLQAVNEKMFRVERNIKETAKNTLTLSPGSHVIKVERMGQEVYSKTIFVSAQEHKIVGL